MKIRSHLATFLLTSFVGTLSAYAGISIAITPPVATAEAEGVEAFVFEILEVNLSGNAQYDLVDRKKLSDMLAEQTLGAAGLTQDQASKVGKLVGAKYYVFGQSKQAGGRTAIQCRVVQVDTGLLKPVLLIVPNNEDPMKAGEQLATQVNDAIAKLEGRSAQEQAAVEAVQKLDVAADAKRPVFAFRIPEVSVTTSANTADPAAEKSLEGFLQTNDCKMVALSRPSQSESAPPVAAIAVLATSQAPVKLGAHLEGKEHEDLLVEARAKGVQVIILGVATSERATQIGSFSAARARVEFSAVRVSDSRILAATSGYGVGTDLSNFVAEKKAIESATEKVQAKFVERIISAYNAPDA
jgi:Curli production assembly/transport component CsgG